jgi:hypothetical protein
MLVEGLEHSWLQSSYPLGDLQQPQQQQPVVVVTVLLDLAELQPPLRLVVEQQQQRKLYHPHSDAPSCAAASIATTFHLYPETCWGPRLWRRLWRRLRLKAIHRHQEEEELMNS